MTAYYNEHDPYAAQWLRNLIEAGEIAPGIVDERSIEDVRPDELVGFTQCHFFAGIGVWSLALRRAGWPDDRQIWTGSCPCQPFSAAGAGAGEDDSRHLWPVFARLIDACRPPVVLGEQVASSLVTGSGVGVHLQRLWERKAHLGVLSDWLEEDVSLVVQGLSQQGGSIATPDAQGVNGDPCIQTGGGREVEGSDEGAAVRLDGGVGAGGTGFRSVRSHWNSLRPHGESWLEYALSGSDSSRAGVYDGQHAGGLVRLERRLRDLGREQDDRDEPRDHGSPERCIKRTAEAVDRELEKEGGRSWIDALQVDLEGMGYAFGAVAFPSAGVGAPHIRDRAYWVANANGSTRRKGRANLRGRTDGGHAQPWAGSGRCGLSGRMGNGNIARLEGLPGHGCAEGWIGTLGPVAEAGVPCGLADSNGRDSSAEREQRGGEQRQQSQDGGALQAGRPGPVKSLWADADWLFCRDGRWRPVEPGTFPLVDGTTKILGRSRADWQTPAGEEGQGHRAGRLKGYGNAINAAAAEAFIGCVMEVLEC